MECLPDVGEHVGGIRGPERAEAVTILSLAIADLLPPRWQAGLRPLVAQAEHSKALTGELGNLRAQLAAVSTLRQTDERPPVAGVP